jgi:hypothetical protein
MFVFFDTSAFVKRYVILGIYTPGRAINSSNRTKS